MLTDCDICAYLPDCSKDPQRQLTGCWRYKFFLEDLQKAADEVFHKGQYCWIVKGVCQEGYCSRCARGSLTISIPGGVYGHQDSNHAG